MPYYCVFGCKPSGLAMHRFPDRIKYPERFEAWVAVVGGKLKSESDYDRYKYKRICDLHFTEMSKTRNNRLNNLAVPTLHLPEQFESQFLQASNSVQQLQTPLTSETGQFGCEAVLENASTSKNILLPSQVVNTDNTCGIAVFSKLIMEHNYTCISRKTLRTTRKDAVGPLNSKVKILRTEISRLRKKGQAFKTRLRNAEALAENKMYQHVAKMGKAAQLFIRMQSEYTKKHKGRRFTDEEKVLSLSLYKKSPMAYAHLCKYFVLPSVKAMKRLLSAIKIHSGINSVIFEKIKESVMEKPLTYRLCSLIFDEMSLTPHVSYNAQKDAFEGFACNQEQKFTDHVLVFMIKGLKEPFKQPIAYYYTNCLNKLELKALIKIVIKHAQRAGLIIVNTVCDQSTVNVGAITELIKESKEKYLRLEKEWRHDAIILNGQNIIPIFDAPHLIKGVRNNLLNKDMVFSISGEQKIVKWEYFQKVYAADKTYGELRLLHKITEEHINPEKINKMRVKSATQIFSHSVAVATEHLVARGDLPAECHNLIQITLLLDQLFDSLNVSNYTIPNGKVYKGPIKRSSPHHALWQKAKEILKTVKFRHTKIVGNKIRLIESTIPSVTNFIKTIEGMEAIWKVLSQKYGFDTLLTRNFNQDPVENFFGNIRSYGVRNNAPNTVAFEGAFKALLLNNYNSPHSRRANCEEDGNKCLQTLQFFLNENYDMSDVPKEEDINCNDDLFSFDLNKEADAGQSNYVCGWVLTKCMKFIVKSCNMCRQNILDEKNSNKNNSYIKSKEYCNKKWLCYPSEELQNCFQDLQNITGTFLKKKVPKVNIKRNIVLVADTLIDFPFNCKNHKENLKKYFTDTTINIILYSWCRSVNRILSGKLIYNGDDEIKVAAQHYYNKHKHFKNKK